MVPYIFIILSQITFSESLSKCSPNATKRELCFTSNIYENDPDVSSGMANNLAQILSLFEFSELDEDRNLLTLSFELQLNWNDTRLLMSRPSDHGSLWHGLSKVEGNEIYFPQLKFKNAKMYNNKNEYGPPKLWTYFYFNEPHLLEYRQRIQLTLSCSFDFSPFPMDSHNCDLHFGSSIHSVNYLKLFPTSITNSEAFTSFGQKPLKLEQNTLHFDITVEGIEPYIMVVDNYEYHFAGARLHLKRNSLGMLSGGFYTPTAIMSILSLLSFFIDPDMVPGRLGLLVTLTLITTNIYTSVKAPIERSFSYIEFWIIGIQAPIFVAIIEYGIILGSRKFNKQKPSGNNRDWMEPNNNDFGKSLDKWTFCVMLTHIAIFNILYWFHMYS